MPIPDNSIPMRGFKGQFGQTVMGSMANILMVRENIDSYDYPGPYEFPDNTIAYEASKEQLERDGIKIDNSDMPPKKTDHKHHGNGS